MYFDSVTSQYTNIFGEILIMSIEEMDQDLISPSCLRGVLSPRGEREGNVLGMTIEGSALWRLADRLLARMY